MKFIIKLLLNGIIVIPMLMWFSDATMLEAATAAVLLCIIAYMVGDQLILRMSNNVTATIADAILAFVFLWAAAFIMDWSISLTEILMITIVLGVAEAIYHRFLHSDRQVAK